MEEFLTMSYSINIWMLVFVGVFTFCCAYYVIRYTKSKLKSLFLGILFFSYFIYSGVGISILNDGGIYFCYYFVYTLVFAFTLRHTNRLYIRHLFTEHKLSCFIEKHGRNIILLYFCLIFVGLIYPENKLQNLISPPLVDRSFVDDRMRGIQTYSALESLIKLLINVLQPFFFLCLYRFRYSYGKLFILLFLPMYFSFCSVAYISRTQILLTLIFFVSIIAYYNPNHRKIVLVGTISFILLFVPLIAAYAEIRQGRTNVELASFWNSLDLIFRVEGTFPMWFEDIYQNAAKETYTLDYILYIIFQPIPGFLKQPLIGDFQVNYSIGELLLHMKQSNADFFIPLSGIIGEAVFIFGRYFFFLHAIICAFIINLSSNFFKTYKPSVLIFLYVICYSGLAFGRAGTTGTTFYPFLIKSVFYINLVLYISTGSRSK